MAPRLLPLFTLTALALTGCKQDLTVRVYRAPKDVPHTHEAAPGHEGHGHGHGEQTAQDTSRPALPKLAWKTPAGWTDRGANQMSAANFSIEDATGKATVSITALGGLAGQDALLVNMWRTQVGLPELSAEDVTKEIKEVPVAGGQGRAFEVAGTREGKTLRIVTAFLHRPEASWFFKLQGDEPTVQAQRAAFAGFLQSVEFGAVASPAPTAPAPATAGASGTDDFAWAVPEGWQSVAPGQMQVAKFAATAGAEQAEITVSIFPNDTGGLAANINRWRRQLGLPEQEAAAAEASATALDGAGPGAKLVMLDAPPKAMLGAVVPRDGQWFFYKATGSTAAVGAVKAAFVQFAAAPVKK